MATPLRGWIQRHCPLQKFVASGAIEPRWWKSRCLSPISLFKSKTIEETRSFPSRTVRYLFWLRRPAQVRQVEINTIQKWLGEYNHEDIDISDIQPGDLVRITSGQFSGEKPSCLTVPTTKPSYNSKN